jgi:hypothetical protein
MVLLTPSKSETASSTKSGQLRPTVFKTVFTESMLADILHTWTQGPSVMYSKKFDFPAPPYPVLHHVFISKVIRSKTEAQFYALFRKKYLR